jgi:hypothetical protein
MAPAPMALSRSPANRSLLKTRARQIGGRYVAWVRGAFNRASKESIGTSRRAAAARCTIAPFRYCLTEKEVVGGQAAGRAVARRKMTVAHTAPEPDGATRGFRARKGGRFRHEPGRILHLRAGGTAAARVECALAGS